MAFAKFFKNSSSSTKWRFHDPYPLSFSPTPLADCYLAGVVHSRRLVRGQCVGSNWEKIGSPTFLQDSVWISNVGHTIQTLSIMDRDRAQRLCPAIRLKFSADWCVISMTAEAYLQHRALLLIQIVSEYTKNIFSVWLTSWHSIFISLSGSSETSSNLMELQNHYGTFAITTSSNNFEKYLVNDYNLEWNDFDLITNKACYFVMTMLTDFVRLNSSGTAQRGGLGCFSPPPPPHFFARIKIN